MKLSILSFFVLSLFMLSSCQKGDDIKDTKEWGDDKDTENICEWDGSKITNTDIWEEYILEELVTSDECDCIVGGVVKYHKIDTNFAYVIYYGKGECDGWAHLVTYYDGDNKKTEKM